MLINGKEVTLRNWPLGYRALFGLLTPSHDSGYGTYEFNVMSPEGVHEVTTSVMVRSVARDNLLEASKGAVDAAKMLATAHVDIINYIATATCFVLGNEGEAELVDNIGKATGIRATAGGISLVNSLKAFNAKKILCYTPYNDEVTRFEHDYLNHAGIEIIGEINRRFENPPDINKVDPYEILADVVSLYKEHKDAEAVFCVGGCFRTLEIADKVERIIGIPFIGTQQSNMWNMMRICGIEDKMEGLGMLFQQ